MADQRLALYPSEAWAGGWMSVAGKSKNEPYLAELTKLWHVTRALATDEYHYLLPKTAEIWFTFARLGSYLADARHDRRVQLADLSTV